MGQHGGQIEDVALYFGCGWAGEYLIQARFQQPAPALNLLRREKWNCVPVQRPSGVVAARQRLLPPGILAVVGREGLASKGATQQGVARYPMGKLAHETPLLRRINAIGKGGS